MASAFEDRNAEGENVQALMPEENGASQRRSLVEHGDRPRKLVTGLCLLEQQNAASTSPHFENGAILAAAVGNKQRYDIPQSIDDMVPAVGKSKSQPRSYKVASSMGINLEMSASSQLLRIADEESSVHAPVAHDTKAIESSLVVAAIECTPQTRVDHRSVRAPYDLQTNSHSRAEGLEQVSEGHITRNGSQGSPSPRPGTKISTKIPLYPLHSSSQARVYRWQLRQSGQASSGSLE
jgi:hypothetical protein